ncbi:MAG: hypothetical protein ACXVYS_16820 [Oryzihumus sp.]
MHQGDRRQGAAASASGGLPAAGSGGAGTGGGAPGAAATVALADRLAAVDASREALAGIEQVLHQCHGADLGPAMGLLDALALLCGRHHTIVHQRGWTATVTATGVTWHT